MAAEGPLQFPPEEALSWTPRQREVLALLAEGKTNAELAACLTLSLEGAKWHVREIMSKLDVGSREETSAYWRRRQSLQQRILRGAGLLLAGFRARWLWPAAGAIISGMTALAFVLAFSGDDSPQEGDVITPSPTASATVAPTGTATPTTGSPISTYEGLPVYELQPGQHEASVPAGSVLYMTATCGACIDGDLYRVFFDADGTFRRELLLTRDQPGLPPGYPLAGMVTDGAGRFAVVWCVAGPSAQGCGKRHDGSVDDTPRILVISTDGGITWQKARDLSTRSFVVGVADGEFVIGGSVSVGDTVEERYSLYPSGRTVSSVGQYGRLGLPLKPPQLEFRFETDTLYVIANDATPLIAVWETNTRPDAFFAFPGGRLSVGQVLSATRMLAAAERGTKIVLTASGRDVPGMRRAIAFVDLDQRTVTPFPDVAPYEDAHLLPLVLESGPLMRIAGAGTCLNVREAARTDAPVLGCFADGALLEDRGEVVTAAGVQWRAVTTPDGRDGWASLDYLERP